MPAKKTKVTKKSEKQANVSNENIFVKSFRKKSESFKGRMNCGKLFISRIIMKRELVVTLCSKL